MPVRIGLGVLAAAAAAVSGYSFYKSESYYNKYQSSRDPSLYGPDEVAEYREKSEGYQTPAWISMGCGLG
jgi:hypothetical protein